MPIVNYQGHEIVRTPEQSVLDALLLLEPALSHACKAGVCQSCLMKVTAGEIPPQSQRGLKPAWIDQQFFLPCHAFPEQDISVEKIDEQQSTTSAMIRRVTRLNEQILQVIIEPLAGFPYHPGQYCTWIRADGLARSYSMASLPESGFLEFHLRIYPDGQMSQWLLNEKSEPREIKLRGPAGECYYQPSMNQRPLYLIGTGTGLAPLLGIVQEAIKQGHEPPIKLFHAANNQLGLYATKQLQELADRCAQFSFETLDFSQLNPATGPRFSLAKHVVSHATLLKQSTIFLCGNPAIIQQLKTQLYLAGANLAHIHSDAFLASS